MAELKPCPFCGNVEPYRNILQNPFRLGKNPNIKPREYTEEQREAMRQRMQHLQKQREAQTDGDN